MPVMGGDPPLPPRQQSGSLLKSAFEKTKSSTGEERRSKSLMSVGSLVTRRASSLAATTLTSVREPETILADDINFISNLQREEARDLQMESEDSLAAEIFHAKVSLCEYSRTIDYRATYVYVISSIIYGRTYTYVYMYYTILLEYKPRLLFPSWLQRPGVKTRPAFIRDRHL